jgi:hypothetical protein
VKAGGRLLGHDLQDALATAADDQGVWVALRAEGNGEVGTTLQTATADLAGDLDEHPPPACTVGARGQSHVDAAGGRGPRKEHWRSCHADDLDSGE